MQSAEFASKSHYIVTPECPINALRGTGLQPSTLKEIDNSDDFDMSASGVIFIAKNPGSDPTKHFGSDLYYIPTYTCVRDVFPKPRIIEVLGFMSAYTSPIFSLNDMSAAVCEDKARRSVVWGSASVRYPQHRRPTFVSCFSPRSSARVEGLASFPKSCQME